METVHPLFVHFPIVLYSVYFVVDVAGIIAGKKNMSKLALIFLLLVIVFSTAAVLTGNMETQKINQKIIQNTELQQTIKRHELYSSLFIWLCSTLLFYRFYTIKKNKDLFYHNLFILFFAIIGMALIIATAYYGGELVYKFGVGTKLFGV
ncbi:DUF2231 domain-containing protein [Melioribacter sp. OK-6-Me]|uniref:DUF2231 domain-containing protein n=1 Tax=unclassified Melioribacter TaxID=2627329 RepID=UPI003ED88ED0